MLILSKSLRTVLTSIGADLIQSRRDLQNAFSDMNTRRTKGDFDKLLRPSIWSKSHKIFSPKCRSRPTDGGQEEEAVNCWTFRRFLLMRKRQAVIYFSIYDTSLKPPAKGRHNDSMQFSTFRNWIKNFVERFFLAHFEFAFFTHSEAWTEGSLWKST